MLRIGCHLSVSDGFAAMAKTAASINATTIQFFSRNPRGGASKEWKTGDISKMTDICKDNDIRSLLAHAPYVMNCCAKDEKIRRFALETMTEDLEHLELLPDVMYNFHPGSHVLQGAEKGIEMIADVLNEAMKPGQKTKVLLETMAGKGTEVGRSFEELRSIIDKTVQQERIGVCLDTCHVWDGGYDIAEHLDEVLDEFDRIIGINRLYAVHINDSMNVLGSHKDRHACIGAGNIGTEAFERIVNHPLLKDLPFYLETPNELEGYAAEIELLRKLQK